MLLLECFRTKLIHYYLPAFPSCAILVTWLVISLSAEGVNLRRCPLGRLSMVMLIGIGLSLVGVLLAGAALIASGLSIALFAIALVLGIGLLVGLIRFQEGAGDRAVYALAGCWTLILIIAAGCAVPMCEPYRTSRVVGERLAAPRSVSSTGSSPCCSSIRSRASSTRWATPSR